MGVWIVLWTARDHLRSKTAAFIFTGNQAVIRVQDPARKSEQFIVIDIVSALGDLKFQGKEIQLH